MGMWNRLEEYREKQRAWLKEPEKLPTHSKAYMLTWIIISLVMMILGAVMLVVL